MAYLDITLPVSESTVPWPGDPPVLITPVASLERGDAANVSRICLSSHTGTHIDAPLHLLSGAPSVDALPLDVLIGPAVVLDLPALSVITPDDLRAANLAPDCQRLLLRTANSERALLTGSVVMRDYCALSGTAGAWLAERGVRLVGIDAPSVDEFASETLPAHRALLSAGVIVVEGLDLTAVAPGHYRLYCLPLRVLGGDGAPARVLLETR